MRIRAGLVQILLAAFLVSVCTPAVVSAQTNPFSDDAKKTKKKKKKKSKKARKKEAEAKAKALDEAVDEAATNIGDGATNADEAAEAEANEPEAETVFDDAMEEETLAEEAPLPADRVPVAANFSTVELIVDGVALGVGVGLLAIEGDVFGKTGASMGDPEKGSVDYDITKSFHGDLLEGGQYFFGISDIMGYTLIAGPLVWYGISAGVLWSGGDPMLDSQSQNVDHSLWGYVETMAWTAAASGLTKTLVGRDRPYKAFERPGYGDTEEEWQSSFYSSFSSFAFASASYVSWDLSDNLVHRKGMGFWTGRVIPFVALYGTAALASAGTIYQQDAYFSDALIGATVGSLIGNLVYITHFDTKGDPNIRHPDALATKVTLAPNLIPTGNSVMIGASAVGRW